MNHARATGWLAWKMKIEGRNGCPDCWFFKNGRIVVMEFKRPVGGKVRVQQQLRIAELRAHGIEVHVVNDAAVGRAILDGQEDLL